MWEREALGEQVGPTWERLECKIMESGLYPKSKQRLGQVTLKSDMTRFAFEKDCGGSCMEDGSETGAAQLG